MFKKMKDFWKTHKYTNMTYGMLFLALASIFTLKASRNPTPVNIIIAVLLLIAVAVTLGEFIYTIRKMEEIEEFEVIYAIGRKETRKIQAKK